MNKIALKALRFKAFKNREYYHIHLRAHKGSIINVEIFPHTPTFIIEPIFLSKLWGHFTQGWIGFYFFRIVNEKG